MLDPLLEMDLHILGSFIGQLEPGIPTFGSFNGARFTWCFCEIICGFEIAMMIIFSIFMIEYRS